MNKRKFLRRILQNPDFFFVLAKRLDEIFSDSWYEIWEDDGRYVEVQVEGTNGWVRAFMLACNDMNIWDCFEYYDSLHWIESDEVDADISMLLEAIVFDEDNNRIER